MQKLAGKNVFITGASAGIGKATAEQCAEQGANLIITARRVERLEALAEQLHKDYQVDVLPLAMDVQNNEQVQQVIADLPEQWRAIDILVNNAGLALGLDPLQNGDLDNWDTMIKTNINGLLYVTHAILPIMLKRQSGHIVNIGSVAGRDYYPGGNIYCATKHAVKAISKTLRIDLLGEPIRVSEVVPGMVHTEFSAVRFNDAQKGEQVYRDFQPLAAEDIADGIVYCITRPAHVDVSVLEIYPTVQASCHHIARS